MKRKLFVSIALLLMAGICKSESNGWVSLFNGKDLKGWKQLNGKAKYGVVDGAIVGTTVANTQNSFLVTEKKYSDFILEVDFKVDQMNSGIQFRSESTKEYKNGRVHGYQCEIDPSKRAWSGGIYDESRRGWLYPMTLNPEGGKAFKPNDWNHYRIECIGNTIRTWVNDVPAAYLIDNMTREGFIALQVHSVSDGHEGRQIRWKNIRIKTQNLVSSPASPIYIVNNIPGNLSDTESKEGWKWLWDGKTTKGWKGFGSDHFPATRWKINDGVLTLLEGKEHGTQKEAGIITEGQYGAYELQWNFMLTPGANGSVKYYIRDESKPESPTIGFEYQLQDNKRSKDTTATHTVASLYNLIKAKTEDRLIHSLGEWNNARVVVGTDKHVEHWLNGIKVLEYKLQDDQLKTLLSKSNFANAGQENKGRIVFMDKGKKISFSDIKIKVLQ